MVIFEKIFLYTLVSLTIIIGVFLLIFKMDISERLSQSIINENIGIQEGYSNGSKVTSQDLTNLDIFSNTKFMRLKTSFPSLSNWLIDDGKASQVLELEEVAGKTYDFRVGNKSPFQYYE